MGPHMTHAASRCNHSERYASVPTLKFLDVDHCMAVQDDIVLRIAALFTLLPDIVLLRNWLYTVIGTPSLTALTNEPQVAQLSHLPVMSRFVELCVRHAH